MHEPEIKAEPGHVIKAYLVDIHPFCHGLVRRVLIDERGTVFVPTSAWHNLQTRDGPYTIIPFQKQMKMFNGFDIHNYWWEKKAWKDDVWSWCYGNGRYAPDFQACYVTYDGAIFAH